MVGNIVKIEYQHLFVNSVIVIRIPTICFTEIHLLSLLWKRNPIYATVSS